MNVEIGAEAGQIPEKEYINGIACAVQYYSNSAKNACASSRKYTKSIPICTV
jgi:hypothetical protein